MGEKHTDGPWIWAWQRTPQAKVYSVIGAGEVIARVHEGSIKRAEANARLIASAPDLLAALILALPYVEDASDSASPADQEIIRAAVARATGEAA
jgi:hypothetical protein